MQQYKQKLSRILVFLLSGMLVMSAQAGRPLWTFDPQTTVDVTVARGETAQIRYMVSNLSKRAKVLLLRPINGVYQASPCNLSPRGSCILVLNIIGSKLTGDVIGGPVLCQMGNPLECYQPAIPENTLHIHLSSQPPIQQFTVIPSADPNGTISPSTTQIVNAGANLIFTATPASGFSIEQWLLDGNVVQNGGNSYQLNNIQANHTVRVTFGQTTLAPLTSSLSLSINSPGADPALTGNPRIIRIQNTGSVTATGVQVNSSGFPAGTLITSNSCLGTLSAGATCDITITPGATASSNVSSIPCTTAPGTAPEATVVSVTADNAPQTDIDVLLLGYGCIYEGGFLFSVDDSTPNIGSIGGKVAALVNEAGGFQWATVANVTTATSLTDGEANTNALLAPVGTYAAAQICFNKIDQGFTNWYLPAICELGRYIGTGTPAGCGITNPNLYTTLRLNGLGNLNSTAYWSSTQVDANDAWLQIFLIGSQTPNVKSDPNFVRCIRIFTP